MKKIGGMAMVAAAVIILVSGGQAFSAERQNSHFFSAPGSWQYEGPVVAGSLPQGEDLSKARTGIADGSAGAEYGGVFFRAGIDTN